MIFVSNEIYAKVIFVVMAYHPKTGVSCSDPLRGSPFGGGWSISQTTLRVVSELRLLYLAVVVAVFVYLINGFDSKIFLIIRIFKKKQNKSNTAKRAKPKKKALKVNLINKPKSVYIK